MAQEIDVFQQYQGNINWSQVKSSGVTMAFVKLTNGTSVASTPGDSYVSGARSQSILVGGYCYALGGSATAQADRFAEELLRLTVLDLAPALDFEDPSLPGDQASRRAWIVSFFTELKAKIGWLNKVLLYASGSWLTAINAGTLTSTVPGLQILIWDAEYGPNDGTEHPIVSYNGVVAVHQYTSVGRVGGVTGAVDRDDVLTDITENDMGALQDTDPNWLQLLARVEAMAEGTDTVKFHAAPVPNEPNATGHAVGSLIPQLVSTLNQLVQTVTALQTKVDSLSGGSGGAVVATPTSFDFTGTATPKTS